ncbi:hypothetical protein ACYULU_09065 [Breznakiellaceae bacterium SP9]
MRFNRKFLFIALLALIFSGCDIDVVDGDKYKDTWVPGRITLSGTVNPDIGGERRPGDKIAAYFNEADVHKLANLMLLPLDGSIGSSEIGTNGEWEITRVKSFIGEKRIYFAIVPEAGGTYYDKDMFNSADSGSDLFVNNRGVLVAVKPMNITGKNRDISNINVGRIAIDTVRLTDTWKKPLTKLPYQSFSCFNFYSDEECTNLVFVPDLFWYDEPYQLNSEWEMLAPIPEPGRVLYTGISWGDTYTGRQKLYITGKYFSTSDTGPIALGSYDISGEY